MDSSQTETSSAPRSTYLNSLAGTAEFVLIGFTKKIDFAIICPLL